MRGYVGFGFALALAGCETPQAHELAQAGGAPQGAGTSGATTAMAGVSALGGAAGASGSAGDSPDSAGNAGAAGDASDPGPQLHTCPGAVEGDQSPHAARQSVFDALTANTWHDSGCEPTSGPLAPTCTRLALYKDGTYTLGSFSDYTERADSGRWNFGLASATTGLLCLDGQRATAARRDAPINRPSALFFDITSGLAVRSFRFVADEVETTSKGSLADLKPVALPVEMAMLVRDGWRNSNDFNADMTPDELTFAPSGHLSASYRGGECTHGGHFSWDKDELDLTSDDNECDRRGPLSARVGATNERPVFLDDLLVLYSSSFRPRSSPNEGTQVFVFDPYSSSLRVRGELEGALTESVATALKVSFENLYDIPRQLVSFEITLRKLIRSSGATGYLDDGEEISVVKRDYTGVTLAPHATHQDSIELTPPFGAELVNISFKLSYTDEHQTWGGTRSYVVTIR